MTGHQCRTFHAGGCDDAVLSSSVHVLPSGGTGVGYKLKLLCGTFHAGGQDVVILSYSFLCSEASCGRLIGLVLSVYRCRRYELGWVLNPDERFLCLGIFTALLAALYLFNCVLGQLPFLAVLVLCQLTCSGGWLDGFSFGCLIVWGLPVK